MPNCHATDCSNICRIVPNGIHGIEERLHVMWDTLVNTGLIKPSDFVRLSSTEAAKVFNLYPQKGIIAPGSDADIAIIDPNKEHVLSAKTHHSALDTSVYEGMKITGKVSLADCHSCADTTMLTLRLTTGLPVQIAPAEVCGKFETLPAGMCAPSCCSFPL